MSQARDPATSDAPPGPLPGQPWQSLRHALNCRSADFVYMILFLDFDGVLHPDPCLHAEQLFEHAPRLADAIAPFTLDIVLSTSWRGAVGHEAALQRLPAALARRVIASTPHFSAISVAPALQPYPRQAECLAWLNQHARGRDWLALDDRSEWFEPYCERLIRCHPAVGLDEEVLGRLTSALQRAGAVATTPVPFALRQEF